MYKMQKKAWISWPLKMRPSGCPETSTSRRKPEISQNVDKIGIHIKVKCIVAFHE